MSFLFAVMICDPPPMVAYGTFQPDPPPYIKVQCAEPVIANAFWAGRSRPPYGYKDTVTYMCLPAYTYERSEYSDMWPRQSAETWTSQMSTKTSDTTLRPVNKSQPVMSEHDFILVQIILILCYLNPMDT
ncbi:hypothetical protein L3Q82_016151 [Scortum barcoo]|uniref:Uncharacterized protein n=1 Tax=Scortum barcoo TaxID=214431 RepID=A0ACB8VQ52_9TELE|nr:hypothetical protein L3Q82_016151 [Scortum barcoo]